MHILEWSERIFKTNDISKNMKGRIQAIYPEGRSSVYAYFCKGDNGKFSIPVEHRYHSMILKNEGNIIGRVIEYDSDMDPPLLKFLD
jgi:hypothetical protein